MTDKKSPDGRTYPLEAFVEAIEAEGGSAGTTDVADTVECSYELAYKRLIELEANGDVNKQTVGNTHIWTVNN